MEDVNENTELGQRIYQVSQQVGISDFYITPWEPLCFKQNGELVYDSFIYNPTVEWQVTPGCLDYAMSFAGERFRVNRMVTRGKLRWVMRLLPTEIPSPFDIAVPPAAMKSYLEAKNGLFLICGATGSGKSTTIAAMIKYRAERRREHVLTFEDPIEFIHPDGMPSLMSQREMGEDEIDFGASLKAALRQAPDVILVGEIRDGETAEIALQAAETGHVVVATLHTSTAAQTAQRFLKLIPSDRVENAQATMADVLKMILCQRLMKDPEKGKRFAIHELLLQHDSTSNLIRRGEFKKLDQELETGWKKGMANFERSMEQRESEGWKVTREVYQTTGYSDDEVEDYLRKEEANLIK
ncbi:MAG: twitching motility protein PilT [Verrucomicrobiales bacterium]|jgi:twitching motility protein PilT